MKTATPCICGKRHRAGTVCQIALRREQAQQDAQAVLDALRVFPAGTTTLLDNRRGTASARVFVGGEALVRQYADGCEDSAWGKTTVSCDGTVLRFARDVAGYVPNSYRYRTETDELHVVAADGRVFIAVHRVPASSRPHGKGSVPDYLMPAAFVEEAHHDGARFLSAWVIAVRAQAALESLARKPRESLSAEESVKLDHAFETGIVDPAITPRVHP